MVKHIKLTITQEIPAANDIVGWRVDVSKDDGATYQQIADPVDFPYPGTPQAEYVYEYDEIVEAHVIATYYYKIYAIDKDGLLSGPCNPPIEVLIDTENPSNPVGIAGEVIYP